jgi:hypothetical protein
MKPQLQIEQLITTLQQDLPTLFEQDISYQIYTNNIYFCDPVNQFKGKFNYRLIFWPLRFHARLFFTEIAFDVHDVSKSDHETIIATWTGKNVISAFPISTHY